MEKELEKFLKGEDGSDNFEMLASTDTLETFDFAGDKTFNIDENFELIHALKKLEENDEQKEFVKLQEAKNIIEKFSKIFLNSDFVDQFNKEEQNLLNLIKKYDPNIDEVRNMPEDQKDKIYEIAQYLFNIFQKRLNELNFIFPLSKNEFKFMLKVFREKLEYDQNEVFQMKELKENFLDNDFNEIDSEMNVVTHINVNDLIVFYHLFAKYKVKGITSEHYDFLQILTKIGERIKLFNAYNVVVQRLSNDFQMWGGSLSVEGELVGQVIEPKNEEEDLISV
jgi:hypothetical protein